MRSAGRAGMVAGVLCLAFGPHSGDVALAQVKPEPQPVGVSVLSTNLQPIAAPSAPGGYAPPDVPVPEGISVASRPRSDYLPVGGRLGSFFLYPELTVTERYTDNVRATDAIRFGSHSVRVAGGAQVVSGFSRHELRAGGWFNRNFFFGHGDENASQYGGAVAARADLPGTTVRLRASAERRVLSREDFNSPNSARSPLSFNRLGGSLDVERRISRFSIAAGGTVARLRYLNVIDDSGVITDQRWRDVTTYTARAEAGYEFNPGFRAIVRGEYYRADYALPANDPAQPGGLDRDSRGWRIEGGVRKALSRVLTGEIRVGYLDRRYADPRLLKASGLSFSGDLLWNVTSLTSLRFRADRRIDEAASAVAAGNRVTEFGTVVEHELRRNVIVTAAADYGRISPLGPSPVATQWSVRGGARLLLDRNLSATLEFRHAERDSVDPLHDYTASSGMAGVMLTL